MSLIFQGMNIDNFLISNEAYNSGELLERTRINRSRNGILRGRERAIDGWASAGTVAKAELGYLYEEELNPTHYFFPRIVFEGRHTREKVLIKDSPLNLPDEVVAEEFGDPLEGIVNYIHGQHSTVRSMASGSVRTVLSPSLPNYTPATGVTNLKDNYGQPSPSDINGTYEYRHSDWEANFNSKSGFVPATHYYVNSAGELTNHGIPRVFTFRVTPLQVSNPTEDLARYIEPFSYPIYTNSPADDQTGWLLYYHWVEDTPFGSTDPAFAHVELLTESEANEVTTWELNDNQELKVTVNAPLYGTSLDGYILVIYNVAGTVHTESSDQLIEESDSASIAKYGKYTKPYPVRLLRATANSQDYEHVRNIMRAIIRFHGNPVPNRHLQLTLENQPLYQEKIRQGIHVRFRNEDYFVDEISNDFNGGVWTSRVKLSHWKLSAPWASMDRTVVGESVVDIGDTNQDFGDG